jgi:hypothetical protein
MMGMLMAKKATPKKREEYACCKGDESQALTRAALVPVSSIKRLRKPFRFLNCRTASQFHFPNVEDPALTSFVLFYACGFIWSQQTM